jgi:hypothetical protein
VQALREARPLAAIAADCDLLFGRLAQQNGLKMNQVSPQRSTTVTNQEFRSPKFGFVSSFEAPALSR